MKKLIFNPYDGIDWSTILRCKANLHTHTTESDGLLYGADVITRYKNAGYSILAITDHDNYRVKQRPQENGAVKYVNSWPWTIWEGTKDYQAPTGTFAMIKDEVLGVTANGMLTVQSCELSGINHINSYDNDYSGGNNKRIDYTNEESAIQALKDRKGVCVINHPGRYGETVQWYVDLYKKFYPILRGLEVYNQGDTYPHDRDLWDDILTELMPFMPVFGWSNDDMHRERDLFRNYQYLLLREFTAAEFRVALNLGRGFFSYEPGGSGNALAPYVNSVVINKNKGTISINADNWDSIEWICEKNIISTGSRFNYKNTRGLTSYVRAKLTNSKGFTYTQPFGFID
ncbi:PHP domain-containing protein [Desulfolucanica intricata]|uniref:PHP domain-containing protein n=1 Tax=Desulfolucanica intricata TaxID=1285191 RepID=UPI000831850C|nr:hypothetical protein [Desulfolucanica intricata]